MIENNDRAFLRMLHLMKRVYYPGSGKDLDTLEFILSEIGTPIFGVNRKAIRVKFLF
jgi:hypothetical protein